ncbi:Mobile element protein [Grimontia indica]|uniref:Mobile element protein n=1 Tax=Grimontia indica TaxID=1056512 RepID=R1ILY5_9GAMM|nr:Mobile element protein [Grimontia indica]
MPAGRVVRVLEQLKNERGLPNQLRVDSGPELLSERRYIQPGKPQQNGFVERFNGSLRHKFMDAYFWLT